MSHQIGFQKAGMGLIPLLERANGNLLLEQCASARRRKTTLPVCSRSTQKAVCGCGTHKEESAATGVHEVEVSLSFQCLDEGRKKRHAPFGLDLLPGHFLALRFLDDYLFVFFLLSL